MMNIEKSKIGSAFDRAAHEYDKTAQFQHAVCERLIQLLPLFISDLRIPARILDGGSGTGFGADLLRQQWAKTPIIGCDLSLEMSHYAQQRGITTVCGDMEKLPFKNAGFDFIWSTLALQWCDPEQVYAELCRVLSTQGFLVFATLESGTLHELDFAFSEVDSYRHVLPFSSAADIENSLSEAGFSEIQIHRETWVTEHADLPSLLKTIRGIGANQVGHERRKTMMGKQTWQAAKTRYETLRTEKGSLPATYQLVFGCARKMR